MANLRLCSVSIEHYALANIYTVLIYAEWILRANL